MVKALIDPDLLMDVETDVDFDMWADLHQARENFKQMVTSRTAEIPEMDDVPYEDHWIAGLEADDPQVKVRYYRAADAQSPAPTLLWIHGGGYVLGTIDVETIMMQMIAKSVGCNIVAVEYRLAPENPFPAPLNDCYAALKWTMDNAEELGIDVARVAIGGISAGGGLTAALALMARDRGEYQPCFQLLLCPMIDDRNEQASTFYDLKGIAWDRDSNHKGWEAYLGGKSIDELPEYAIPSRAKDLSGLPPAYIAVGSLDLLMDENMVYARRLLEAEVATELHIFPGGTHAFEFKVIGARMSRRAHMLNFEILKHVFAID